MTDASLTDTTKVTKNLLKTSKDENYNEFSLSNSGEELREHKNVVRWWNIGNIYYLL